MRVNKVIKKLESDFYFESNLRDYERKKEQLLKEASYKPIRRFIQFDVFQDANPDPSDVIPHDKDGDCIFQLQQYELKNLDDLRVLVPYGKSPKDAIRGLKKVIKIIKDNPDSITQWNRSNQDDFSNIPVMEESEMPF